MAPPKRPGQGRVWPRVLLDALEQPKQSGVNNSIHTDRGWNDSRAKVQGRRRKRRRRRKSRNGSDVAQPNLQTLHANATKSIDTHLSKSTSPFSLFISKLILIIGPRTTSSHGPRLYRRQTRILVGFYRQQIRRHVCSPSPYARKALIVDRHGACAVVFRGSTSYALRSLIGHANVVITDTLILLSGGNVILRVRDECVSCPRSSWVYQ